VLTDFLQFSGGTPACYASKATGAERVYAALSRHRPPPARSRAARTAFAKCLEDFLRELKRLEVCISSRLSRERAGEKGEELRRSRKTIGALRSGVEKRVKLLVPDPASANQAGGCSGGLDASGCCAESPRHLCAQCCYLHAFAPARKMKELSDYCEWHNLTRDGREPALDPAGWEVRARVKARSKAPPRRDLVWRNEALQLECGTLGQVIQALGARMDPSYTIASLYQLKTARGQQPIATASGSGSAGPPRRIRNVDRRSPFGLIEELFWRDGWKLLVCCILLNKTTRRQLDPVLFRFFERFPNAPALLAAEPYAIQQVISPLGLQRKRTQTLLAFSRAFLSPGWTRVADLPGIGAYAEMAYNVFHLGTLPVGLSGRVHHLGSGSGHSDSCDSTRSGEKLAKAAAVAHVQDHALNWFIEYSF